MTAGAQSSVDVTVYDEADVSVRLVPFPGGDRVLVRVGEVGLSLPTNVADELVEQILRVQGGAS